MRQARAKATSQQKGVEAVIRVQQGNGAVVGRVRAIPRLVQNGNETLMEARGQDASGGNGRKESREERGKGLTQAAVQISRDAIQPRRAARLGPTQRPQYLLLGKGGATKGSSQLRAELAATAQSG